jgi:23S rRNA A1618 N6-methylase RlmF
MQNPKLHERITLLSTDPKEPFFSHPQLAKPRQAALDCFALLKLRRIDFTMSNPPFYDSEAEVRKLAAKKDLPPLAVS